MKLHIICGVKTNVITSVEVTSARVHDTRMFQQLVEDTADKFTMERILADKGYLSHANFKTAIGVGAEPYIPFKRNTTGKESELFGRLFHLFQYKREEFLAHYHKRSNVESTMRMIKAKFGEHIRAKTPVAQENELLCKILCHNICCLISGIFELGLEVEFWKEQREAA